MSERPGRPTPSDQRVLVAGASPRAMFARADTTIYPVRRARAMVVTLVLHAAAVLPFLVSTIRVESRPVPSLEPLGVTFVMTPERGIGSPPARPQPEPKRVEPPPAVPKPVETAPALEQMPLNAESLTPLLAALTLDVVPPPPGSNLGATTDVAAGAPAPPPVSGIGSGGVGDSLLPPALGAPSGQSNWAGLVLGRLEQFRRYPAAARRDRLEGVSYVRFTIDRKGHVLVSALARTSGHDFLDREAVTLVRRADPLPAPPSELEGDTITLTVPVEFFLTR